MVSACAGKSRHVTPPTSLLQVGNYKEFLPDIWAVRSCSFFVKALSQVGRGDEKYEQIVNGER